MARRKNTYEKLVDTLVSYRRHDLATRVVALYEQAVALAEGRPVIIDYDELWQLPEEVADVIREAGVSGPRSADYDSWLANLASESEVFSEARDGLLQSLKTAGFGKGVIVTVPEPEPSAIEQLLDRALIRR